jgi:hypothetical protein
MAVSTLAVRRYTVGGDIYTGVTLPADRTPLVLTNGVPPGGTHVGSTIGVATVEYRPTVNTVDVEQAFGGVAPYISAEAGTLRWTIGEATYQNVQAALGQATHTVQSSTDVLKLGGNTDVPNTCIAIVSHLADAPTQCVWLCVYHAVSMEGGTISFARGTTRAFQVTYNMLADVNRSIGDQLFQYFEQYFAQ